MSDSADTERLLDGVHHARFRRIDVGGEVADEVVLGEPGEALVVDEQVRERRGRRPLLEQRADALALVEPEGRDVDEADGVRRVGPRARS